MRLEVISKEPASGNPRPAPLLFVHGLFVGSWCWAEHFLDYFAAHGYSAHALSLRGHGQSEGREGLRWTRLADYVDDVAQVVARLPAPPVLIGHSYGGAVIQKYLETRTVTAAVLVASAPPQGLLTIVLRLARRHPLVFLKANLTLSLYPVVSTPALARDLFFSESMSEEKVRDYQARMSDESYRSFLDMTCCSWTCRSRSASRHRCWYWVQPTIRLCDRGSSKPQRALTTLRPLFSRTWDMG